MTKKELIKYLQPFTDDIMIFVEKDGHIEKLNEVKYELSEAITFNDMVGRIVLE